MRPCTLVGNVGANPELRYTPNGNAVADFNLALYAGKDMDGNPMTTWVRISAWKDLAEVVANRVGKGDKLEVSGYLLPVQVYEKKDGTPGQAICMTAFNVRAMEWAPVDLDTDEIVPAGENPTGAKEKEDKT